MAGRVGECFLCRYRLSGWPHGVEIHDPERRGGRSLRERWRDGLANVSLVGSGCRVGRTGWKYMTWNAAEGVPYGGDGGTGWRMFRWSAPDAGLAARGGNARPGTPRRAFPTAAMAGRVGECFVGRHRMPGWPHGVEMHDLERRGGRSLRRRWRDGLANVSFAGTGCRVGRTGGNT